MYRSTPPTLGCPECAIGLEPVVANEERSVVLFTCTRCGGAWIEPEASMAVLQGKADPSGIQRASKPPAPRPKSAPEVTRPCARCSEAMLPYQFGDVILDTCPAHGTWFDHDEIERVVKAARAMGKKPVIELPTGEGVWATAKFTAGMLMMPFEMLGNVLSILTKDSYDAFVRGEPPDDDQSY